MADLVIDPADVVPPSGNATTYVQPIQTACGEPVAAGDVLCQLASDGLYYLADANDPLKRVIVGVAGCSAEAAGQRIQIISVCRALVIGAHGLTVGDALFLSNTPGKICPFADLTAGSLPILIGFVASATAIQIAITAAAVAKA